MHAYLRKYRHDPLVKERKDDNAIIPLSFTVSGGVSLGSYQAGYLFYATEWLKRTPRFQVNLVTGASAGSINALLTVLSLCGEGTTDPESSPFWKAWVPIGIDQLKNGSDSPLGLLNRRNLQATADTLLAAIWKQGPTRPCDMVLGLTSTRLSARPQELVPGMEVAKQKEKFILHIESDTLPGGGGAGIKGNPEGTGKLKWKVGNYLMPTGRLKLPFLPVGKSDSGDRKALSQALFASASFPLAFPPQPVKLCLVDTALYRRAAKSGAKEIPEWDDLIATARKEQCPDTTFFVDGGVLDNNPLKLAYKIASKGLELQGDSMRWKKKPSAGEGESPPRSLYFMYLDPDQSIYPRHAPFKEATGYRPLLETYTGFGMDFVDAARSEELNALVEDVPSMSRRVGLTANYFPLMSDYLSAFFGFYEKEFRVFDFNMGMLDAFKYISEEVVDAGDKSMNPRENEGMKALMQGFGGRFECLMGVLGPQGDSGKPLFGNRETCRDSSQRDFSVLLRASMDQFEAACAPHQDSIRSKLEGSKAAGGESRDPLDRKERHCYVYASRMEAGVPGQPRLSEDDSIEFRRIRARKGSLAEFDALLFLLDKRGFRYQDIKDGETLSRNELKREIHDDWGGMIDGLADRQGGSWFANLNPLSQRNRLRVPGKPAVNLFHYFPPRWIVYSTFGVGAEAGISRTLARIMPNFPILRMNGGMQSKNISSFFASGPAELKLTPFLGPELECPYNNAWLQWRTALRFGLEYDRPSFVELSDGKVVDAARNCRRVLQLAPSVSLFERYRIQMVGEWLNPFEKEKTDWKILFELAGFQFI
ncbi:MAG: patatin-like phospholipase family protein [Fibrobacteria bacterium]